MRRWGLFFFTALLLSGCFLKCPTRTTRPRVSLDPWEEKTVRSRQSGAVYDYMYLAGPAEQAPAMVLLHGGFFDNRIWVNFTGLQKRFRVFALKWPDNSLYYSGHVEDFGAIARDFLASLGLKRVHLAGVSMGAYAAVDVAAHPHGLEVESLTLLSAVMFAINDDEIEGRTKMVKRALGFAPGRLQSIVEWRALGTEYPQAPGALQQKDIFYVRPYPYYYQVLSMALNQGDRAQETDRITCPVLLASGTEDGTMPVDVVELSSKAFTNAKKVEFKAVPDQSHGMAFNHGQELARMMLDYFRRVGVF